MKEEKELWKLAGRTALALALVIANLFFSAFTLVAIHYGAPIVFALMLAMLLFVNAVVVTRTVVAPIIEGKSP